VVRSEGSEHATRWRRVVALVAIGLASIAVAGWYWQSELIGIGARWYLARVAAREEASGDLSRRRNAVARLHRVLLLAPPRDALVPELFDFLTALSARVATGEIDLDWAAYLYTSYERDLVNLRPTGTPRRTTAEIATVIGEQVRFFSLRKRRDRSGMRLRDLDGSPPGNSYTVEEIDRAAREGRKLPGE
jgi:hypothetical protein